MIILFTTHCPVCEMLQQALDSKNIFYEIREDIEEIKAHGFTHVPVLKVAGKYMNAKEALAWVKTQDEYSLD